VNARIGWKALTAAEYVPDGFTFLSTPNIKTSSIDFENVNYITEGRFNESPELRLASGDVLLVKDGNTLGITNLVRDLPRPTTVNGSIAVLRPFGVEPAYLRYVLASDLIQGLIHAVKDGMGVPHLFQRDIKRLPVPLPPLDEQRRIINYLDAEMARIDLLIDLRQAQSALVLEQVQARLDDQVERLFRIGRVTLKRLAVGIEQGASPQCDSRAAEPGECGVLKLSAVKSGAFHSAENKVLPQGTDLIPRYQVREGDLLVTRANTPELVGDTAVAKDVQAGLQLCDLIYRVRLAADVSSEFVATVLLSSRLRGLIKAVARGSSASMVKLRGEDILNLPIPSVDRSAQDRLATLALEVRAYCRATQEALGSSVDLLRERRHAIIASAVTGQLDMTTARRLV
jgi:type I restriction enzyme S subunit